MAVSLVSRKDRTAAGPLYGTPIGSAPPAPTSGDYVFAFLGDSRDNNAVLARNIRGAVQQGCAFAADAGDLTAHGKKSSYKAFVKTVLHAAAGRLAVYPVIGNHDRNAGLFGAKRKSNYREFFGEPSYTMWYGRDAFVVIDNADKQFTAEDASSLEAVLSSVRPGARHLFVIGHVPPVDPRESGHHCLPPADGPRFMALMQKYNVAMMLFSHIHGYWQTTVDGTPLVVSGGAGSRLVAGQQYSWVRIAVSDSGVTAQEVAAAPEGGGNA